MPFVIGVEGGFGQGKTLTATIKAQQWAAASGARIYANFPMKNAYIFEHFTDWYRIADDHGSIVVFDESQSNFDSRKWGGQENITLTQIFNFVRKLNCIFIFILPDFSNIDSRIRAKTEILIRCFKGGKTAPITNLVYDFQDKQFGDNGRLLTKWFLPYASQKKVFALDLYDTNSMVHRFPMPGTPKETERFFKILDERHTLATQRLGLKREIETLVKEDLTYAV